MWYPAKSLVDHVPVAGVEHGRLVQRHRQPWVIPPISCERAVFGLMTRPTSNTPSSRGTRISPVSSCTRTSANWAPKLCIAYRAMYGLSGHLGGDLKALGGHRAAVLVQGRAQLGPPPRGSSYPSS